MKSVENINTIGGRIESIAKKIGGKRALARRIGVSETAVHSYIKEGYKPGSDVLSKIADAGKVEMKWLLNGPVETVMGGMGLAGNAIQPKEQHAEYRVDYAFPGFTRGEIAFAEAFIALLKGSNRSVPLETALAAIRLALAQAAMPTVASELDPE